MIAVKDMILHACIREIQPAGVAMLKKMILTDGFNDTNGVPTVQEMEGGKYGIIDGGHRFTCLIELIESKEEEADAFTEDMKVHDTFMLHVELLTQPLQCACVCLYRLTVP